MQQAERLFFVATTIKEHTGITAKELAERCNVSERTIMRDIRKLDNAGIQILPGRKGYTLVDPIVHTQGKLSAEEYMAISLYPLLTGQALLKENPFRHSFENAMDKILTRFRVNDDLKQLSKRIRIDSVQINPEHDQVLLKMMESILQSVTIKCSYYTMSRQDLTERMIDPYYLVPRDGILYVIGWCHRADDIRTFRLNRFQKVELTNKKFYLYEEFDIDQYLSDLWGIEAQSDQPVTFRVRFAQEVARYIREARYDSQPTFEDEPDGTLLLTVSTRSVDSFLRWVRQYGKDAELLEPLEYRARMIEEVGMMYRQYSNSAPVKQKT